MKGRESGLPDEAYWRSFFDAECVISKLFGEERCQGNVVDFGCGHGTFTIPAAGHATGTVYAFDIEGDLIRRLEMRAKREGVSNIVAEVRDFAVNGTGLDSGSQSHAMVYNLLHIENPKGLLGEAYRVLRPKGRVSVMHWRSDIPTPRGPSPEIRPSPAQCKAWIEASGFHDAREIDLEECCKYHFGMVAIR